MSRTIELHRLATSIDHLRQFMQDEEDLLNLPDICTCTDDSCDDCQLLAFQKLDIMMDE